MGDIVLPERPEKPLQSDCCDSGCSPCILDVYKDLLKQWEDRCSALRSGASLMEEKNINYCPALQKAKYSTFKLVSVKKLTSDTNIYRFQAVLIVKGDNLNEEVSTATKLRLEFEPTHYLILQGQETLEGVVKNFTRAYTPISDKNLALNGSFDVVIKLYPNGKMSQYLQKLTDGDLTLWRGPYGDFYYTRNSFKHILMLCAGTGVAPMYSLARKIVNDDEDDTLIKMIFCCKDVSNVILRQEIHALRSYWNFSCHIYLAHENELNCSTLYGESLRVGRVCKDVVASELRALRSEEILVVICGNPTFCKEMEDGVRQSNFKPKSVHIF